MKQTSEQYFNNLPQEPEVCCVSGWCPSTPTPIPQGYYECPNCVGTGEIEDEYYDEDDEEEYWKKETCDCCKGKGYITLKKLNKWKKENEDYCVSAYMEN